MKKIATLILATIIWTVCSAQDNSDTTDNKNFFYLNPLPFVNNTFQINFERLLSNKIGLLLSSGCTLVSGYDDGKRGGNGEIQFRIYLSDTKNKARKLFYFSPYARFQYIESTLGYYQWNNDNKEYYFIDLPDVYVSSYTGGLLIGFKWVLNTRLSIDTYIGGGMQISQFNGEKVFPTMDIRYYGYYTGPIPKLGIQFGYNF
ncbi:MAG: hypothetical protein WC974_09690 [Thermoplasmata archaeon]